MESGLKCPCLILHKTKLYAAALAPFKAYEGDGFPYVIDLSLLAHVKETSGVPKQSQAQHEMLDMLKPWLFLQPYYGIASWNYSLLRTGLELLPTLSMLLSLVFSGLLSF
ncbi:hypothetical protein C5167_022349 [Papaver somniferum]|uniref:Uncharacterized protein n=1 Tax=Papaver somniferum TaxID=3469 RepID=A0A4Y7JKQ1_PAPSO|nr:hypothetical protein C5167_022349 [Papaver somniferum]